MRSNKRSRKEKIKRIFAEVIARVIYYSITSIFGVACILLVLGTANAIVDLCIVNKMYCICYLIVCSYIVTRWILKGMY